MQVPDGTDELPQLIAANSINRSIASPPYDMVHLREGGNQLWKRSTPTWALRL
jgi:hypothetical protein|eukprot:COSAG06_NODE_2691_length_6430_cov_2.427648_6_plen_53_part_00